MKFTLRNILSLSLLFIFAIVARTDGFPACSAMGYGQLTGIPPVGTVTYVEFTDTVFPPAVIRTEDCINCGLGTDQGYQGGYFRFISCPGWSGIILFTGIGAETGKGGWSYYYFEGSTTHLDLGTIDFGQTDKPVVPANPRATWKPKIKSVVITWKRLEKELSYLVYRSMMASGAENSHSNGEYFLIGITDGSFFVDRNIPGKGDVSLWYIIISRYDDEIEIRLLSGHSEESDELIVPNPIGNNTAEKWGELKSAD